MLFSSFFFDGLLNAFGVVIFFSKRGGGISILASIRLGAIPGLPPAPWPRSPFVPPLPSSFSSFSRAFYPSRFSHLFFLLFFCFFSFLSIPLAPPGSLEYKHH